MKPNRINRIVSLAATSILFGQIAFLIPARADWDPTQPAKWYQLPDLQQGMDVYATFNPQLPYNKILADDFLCTQSGPITDIHIWGSWLNDRVPRDATGAPIAPRFHLSFHSDVPKSPTDPYSHPGPELWSLNLIPSQSRIYAIASERFYDPNINQVIGTDTQVWQYNFFLPTAQAFSQQVGNIYWLDVQVEPPPAPAGEAPYLFGWKTSFQHFNDDAVYGDNFTFGGAPEIWHDMHDPATGQSLDMAFVLTTIPEPGTFTLIGLGAGLLLVLQQRRQARS